MSNLTFTAYSRLKWGVAGILLLLLWAVPIREVAAQPQAVPVLTGLKDARSVYITPLSEIYVVETGRHRLLKSRLDGARLDSLGSRGFGDYELNSPLDVDATNGLKIYVTDHSNNRVQVYDRRLQYLSSITTPPRNLSRDRYSPTVIVSNSLREIFFYDSENRHIIKYNPNGEWSMNFDSYGGQINYPPTDITSSEQKLLVADSADNVIHVLSNLGQYEKFIALPKDFSPLAINADANHVNVLGTDRILELSLKGRIERKIRLPGHLGLPKDIERMDNTFYILTASALYRLSPPR